MELIEATLRLAAPLLFAATGGVLSERAGVVNLALEGKMLVGAFAAVAVCATTGNPWMGALAGVLAGTLLGLLHAALTRSLSVSPVLSGLALNLVALGGTTYGLRLTGAGGLDGGATLPGWLLSGLALAGAATLWGVLNKTPLGLRLRAAGERPGALTASGVSVGRLRYGAVTIAGALAGLGGVTLALVGLGSFTENMTAGRGYLALAAVILGRWNPLGAGAAALLFGLGDALQVQLQTRGVRVPSDWLQLLPYFIALLALSVARNRSAAPAALG